MQNIMFSFVCICVLGVLAHHNTANYSLHCVLCIALYINIDMRASLCVLVCG